MDGVWLMDGWWLDDEWMVDGQKTNIFHVENSQIRNMTFGCLIQRTLAGINQSVLTFLCKVSQLFV